MLPYRLRQVLERYRGRPLDDEARQWVAQRLSHAQQALFYAQEIADQRHALTVAQTLLTQGERDERLLQAALLHDSGKAPGVPLFYRTLLVLGQRFAPARLARLNPDHAGWLAPLARAVHHPALGAALAAQAGSAEDVVAFIAHHQAATPPLRAELQRLHAALQAVDDAT
ncbi:MAG: hypothetical protein KDD73_15795 [Anaerolineales bacterium]|nr:hypothetical protein [Anaerolineales bacterium]